MTVLNPPSKVRRYQRQRSILKSSKTEPKALKPTAWGSNMLAKMEVFRKALAAQR